ncbi:anti-sigma factor [Yinghuangia soli]|uniref:Regulator of SigK n=1 Tax=Yinghuangia soli TaxID=2908204 RepID=A0AA41PX89_9ACTN|nr:anti-sigma factor [Yinghuangia soli]MCF2527560.1 anti-sigma factor [Yinghuangia soli]
MNHPLGPARRSAGDGDDAHALTGPYAVDALDAAERAAVERHLEACPACREEVRELRETAARLASTTAVRPPDRLRARVMSEIRSVRQVPPPRSAGAGGAHAALPIRRTRAARLPWLAAAAMFAAAVVLGVLLMDAKSGGDTRAERIAAVIAAPDARGASGAGPDGSRMTVLASREVDRMLVLADGLPPAGPARVYQVWFMTDAGVRSAGLLDETAGGNASASLMADRLGDAARIGVTLEPAGGSPAPTTRPVLVMTLPV